MSDNERKRWNSVAVGWHDYIPWMREWYAPATELMLDLAGVGPGSRVLDVATGDGDQALDAAARVGAEGHVLAIDVSGEMLEIAAQVAAEAGYDQVETRVMNGAALDLAEGSFDAVMCRFGLMFFPDVAAALREWRRVLRGGGRTAVVVYGTDGSPEFSVAVEVVRDQLGLTNEPKPAAVSLGADGVVAGFFAEAGYVDVADHALMLPVRMESAAACVGYLQHTSPTLKALLAPLTPVERMNAWEAVEVALMDFEDADGFEVQHQVIVVGGRKP